MRFLRFKTSRSSGVILRVYRSGCLCWSGQTFCEIEKFCDIGQSGQNGELTGLSPFSSLN